LLFITTAAVHHTTATSGADFASVRAGKKFLTGCFTDNASLMSAGGGQAATRENLHELC
jgi:hypothetical protein